MVIIFTSITVQSDFQSFFCQLLSPFNVSPPESGPPLKTLLKIAYHQKGIKIKTVKTNKCTKNMEIFAILALHNIIFDKRFPDSLPKVAKSR